MSICALVVGFIILLILIRCFNGFTSGKFRIQRDLTDTTVVITGATAGMGEVCARELCAHGAEVYVLCRNTSRAETLVREWKGRCHVIHCQLDSLASVRQAAQQLLDKAPVIHVLLNNAGIGSDNRVSPKRTEDGLEYVMASNYFGHFLLTLLLIPAFQRGSRIINVSSLMHRFARGFSAEDLNFECQKNSGVQPYNHSKLALILFTRELASRLQPKGITVNALHPGVVSTNIVRHFFNFPGLLRIVRFLFKTPEEGAMTSLYLAVSKEVEHVSGAYFSDCRPSAPCLQALDDALAVRVWEKTCALLGLNFCSPKPDRFHC